MERYVEEARRRYIKNMNNLAAGYGIIGGILCVIGVICFCAGADDDVFYFAGGVCLACGIMFIICTCIFIGAKSNCNKIYAPIEDIIRRYGETGENIGGILVGERLAYIPGCGGFVVYKDVKWIERKTSYTDFYMRNGSFARLKNADLPQEGFGAICGKIKARRDDVLFGAGRKQEWKAYVKEYKRVYQYREEPEDEPDIVYEDNNEGGYGSGGYDSDSGYNGGLLG